VRGEVARGIRDAFVYDERMRRAWLSFALAGCYSASPQAGVPCDPAAPNCPNGQMCVMRAGDFVCDSEPGDNVMIDAPIDVVTANDMDGDGIPNANDNCPERPNPTQANEDNDATGDACDNCPPYPSTGADQDNDGVGDVCDPHVLIPGDSIALFEGFAGGMPAGWITTGTWSVVQGNLVSTANQDDLATLVIPYAHTPNQTIFTHATITALTSQQGGSIGIVDRFNGNEGLHCGGGRLSNNTLFGLINAANGTFVAQASHPFAVNTLYRLTFTRTNNTYVCQTIQLDGTSTMVSDEFANGGGPNIGFRNRTASASFPWILVVKSP
jgi:hypothetical protein